MELRNFLWKYLLLNVVMSCLPSFLCTPSLFATEKTPNATYRMEKDTGWNVCRDMVKNLNRLQPSEASFRCELRFHPEMTQFSEPEWEELDIADYWQEVYTIEKYLRQVKPETIQPFDEWRVQYLEDMRTGYRKEHVAQDKVRRLLFHPRLRMTKVRFEANGALETILAYTRLHDHRKYCLEQEEKCPITVNQPWGESIAQRHLCVDALVEQHGGIVSGHDSGEHIVLYEQKSKTIRFLTPRDYNDFVTSMANFGVLFHQHRAYMYELGGPMFSLVHVRNCIYPNSEIYLAQTMCKILRHSNNYLQK